MGPPEDPEAHFPAFQALIDAGKSSPICMSRPHDRLHLSTAEPLTEEEVQQKEEYEAHPFFSWSKRDFQQFIRGIEKNGRYEMIL